MGVGVLVVWGRGLTFMKACDWFQIWGRMGVGVICWVGVLMDIVFEGVLKWVGRCLVSIFSLRLVWRTIFIFGMIFGVVNNPWKKLSHFYMRLYWLGGIYGVFVGEAGWRGRVVLGCMLLSGVGTLMIGRWINLAAFLLSFEVSFSLDTRWRSDAMEVEEQWGVWYSLFLWCVEGSSCPYPLEGYFGCEGHKVSVFLCLEGD